MTDSAFWSVVFVLAALTAGYGKGPDTARPSQEATPATEEGAPAAEQPTRAEAKVISNSIGMTLVGIPAGEFMMGSPDSASYAHSNEKPQHRVRITKPFYLGAYEVTQGQYEKVMGKNPSFKKSGPDAPVEGVSWDDAQEFCRKLSELAGEKEAGRRYRLPTEAEWEYACRAGSAEKYCYGGDGSRLGDYAWYSNNSDGMTHQVGQKKPNAWGLYDIHGNVWEWCVDWYGSGYYAISPMDDPAGPATGSYRVGRGGGWGGDADDCRSAYRLGPEPGSRGNFLGFRVAVVRVDLFTDAVASGDNTAAIRALIPSASAMMHADYERLASASAPRPSSVEDRSLTLMLLALEVRSDDEKAEEQFRYLTDRYPSPSDLSREAYRTRRHGKRSILLAPVTFIHEDRITDFVCKVDGDVATGTVSFRVPELYEGKVDFVARRFRQGWGILEFRMPAYGIHIVRTKHGLWKEASDIREEDRLRIPSPLEAAATENLQRIALAMHTYHDARKSFPAPASYDADGNPLLSWRVHLLPYLGQQKLYDQFQLEESWNSEHNRQLIPNMPNVYRSPASKLATGGRTSSLLVVGPGTSFPGKEGIALFQFKNSGKTALALEFDDSHAVTWTKPEDFLVNQENPLKGLAGFYDGDLLVLFGDGHVERLAPPHNPQVIRAMFSPAGEEESH